MNERDNYSDIINMPRHVSRSHAHMPTCERAKIFAPFAALRGFDDAVRVKARLSEARANGPDGSAADERRIMDGDRYDPDKYE